jgi:hypothetical protein
MAARQMLLLQTAALGVLNERAPRPPKPKQLLGDILLLADPKLTFFKLNREAPMQ